LAGDSDKAYIEHSLCTIDGELPSTWSRSSGLCLSTCNFRSASSAFAAAADSLRFFILVRVSNASEK
jgi:hypothetical protein